MYVPHKILFVIFLIIFGLFISGTKKHVFAAETCSECMNNAIKGGSSIDVALQRCAAACASCQDSGESGLNLYGCYKLNATQTVSSVYWSPAVLVNLFVKLAFIAGGIILFFLIMYAGYLHIQGSTKGQEQAIEIMTTAVTGFIIMFAAYWILQIIKIVTGADIGF